MLKKQGFTLLELIVVIIIVGILATLGFTQYSKVVEKGRTADAKQALGTLRKLQEAYYQEYRVYANVTSAATDVLGASVPWGIGYACSSTSSFFQYRCLPIGGRCMAYRCTSGGRTPNASAGYYIGIISNTGVWYGTRGYY